MQNRFGNQQHKIPSSPNMDKLNVNESNLFLFTETGNFHYNGKS